MVAHEKIAKISFTGSTATGKLIAAAAAPTLKRLTLELGGNDAAIVLADADVSAVAATVFNISFGNAGHFCAAIKRLYVHDDVYEELCAALAVLIDGAVLGPQFDPAVTMGPVQNRPQFDRIWRLFDDAVAQGGQILKGGARHDGPGLFIPPTLVAGIGHGVALVDEEQFGPVLPILRFSDEEKALSLANDSSLGLGGSVWTRDLEHGIALAERLDVGSAWINQHGAFSAALPMPFAKQSGIGMDYAEFGLLEHSQAFLVNAKI
jgi:acyl-CoA reductase-like NAD-dependent aldehyde dehydrogenase